MPTGDKKMIFIIYSKVKKKEKMKMKQTGVSRFLSERFLRNSLREKFVERNAPFESISLEENYGRPRNGHHATGGPENSSDRR